MGQRANSPATGGPGITGTVQAGETLTATTDGIEDEDGLTGAVFAYQWVRSGADIEGAASSTYTVTGDDEGKPIQVRVTFTDDAGNAESLTSYAKLSAPPLIIPDEEPPPKSTATREAREAQGAQEAAETPLTAATHDAPGSHNGQEKFTFELRFSEELGTGFSYKTLRDYAFTVTRGTVAGARRLDSDSDTPNIRWEISVTPDSNADVTVELPITTDCEAQGAICTADGTMLSSPLKFTVKGPPLTANTVSVPTSHNGSGEFRFRIAFSEEFSLSYKTLRDDHVFTVEGGKVTGARRLVKGSNIGWEIVVKPDSNGDVTVKLPVTEDCDAQGAICTDDDRMLSSPPGVHRQRAGPVAGNEKSKHIRTGEAGAQERVWSRRSQGVQPSTRPSERGRERAGTGGCATASQGTCGACAKGTRRAHDIRACGYGHVGGPSQGEGGHRSRRARVRSPEEPSGCSGR